MEWALLTPLLCRLAAAFKSAGPLGYCPNQGGGVPVPQFDQKRGDVRTPIANIRPARYVPHDTSWLGVKYFNQ